MFVRESGKAVDGGSLEVGEKRVPFRVLYDTVSYVWSEKACANLDNHFSVCSRGIFFSMKITVHTSELVECTDRLNN